MKENALFAGYATLEAWAEVVDPTRPVYAARPVEPSAYYAAGGPVVYDLCVVVAQPDAAGLLHYCRLDAATLTLLYGEPFDSDVEMRKQCQADMWQFVQEWLSEQGFTVREAAFDTPKDFKPSIGRADFLAWNEETRRYYRTDRAS